MRRISIFISLLCLVSIYVEAQNELHGPIDKIAIVRKISDDGKYVVGKYDQNPKPAFLWDIEAGNTVVQLDPLTPGEAFDVTNSKQVVSGFMDPNILYNDLPIYSGGIWADGVWTSLGLGIGEEDDELMGDSYGSGVNAITEDGNMVAGISTNAEMTSWYAYPTSWRNIDGTWQYEVWDFPENTSLGASIIDISADGSVAVGWTGVAGSSSRRPIIWTSKDSYEVLQEDDLSSYGEYTSVSANGNYASLRIKGQAAVHDLVTGELFTVPEGFLMNGVSNSGFAVGAYRSNGIDKGFVWSKELGFMDFGEFIATFASDIELPAALASLDPANQYNYALNSISADGLNITIWTTGFRIKNAYVLSLNEAIVVLPYPKNLTGETEPPAINTVKLAWEAPILDQEVLTGYSIYRDGVEIEIVEPDVLTYSDENVPTGQHTYAVKAVYDDAQSRSSNLITVSVVDTYEMPFYEDFTSNDFETNFWTTQKDVGSVNSPTWYIFTDTGIDGSGATMEINNRMGDFDSSLITKYLDGTEATNVYLSFATKSIYYLQEGEMPSLDVLSVEVYDGSTWQTAYEYTYAETMYWQSDIVDITDFAAGNYFKVRFHLKGYNSTINVKYICFDDVRISTSLPEDQGPANVLSNITEDKLQLAWRNSLNEMYAMTYAQGPKEYSIGNGGANLVAVNNFEREDLEVYDNLYLSSISAYINKKVSSPAIETTLKLAVFVNGERVIDTPISEFTVNDWNTFNFLENRILINDDIDNLKFGIEVVTHDTAEEPIGCDGLRNPISGKGDVYSEDGGTTWATLTEAGKVNNWCIAGNLTAEENGYKSFWNSDIAGYNVYLDGEKLNDYMVFGQSYTTDKVDGYYTVRAYSLATGLSLESESIYVGDVSAMESDKVQSNVTLVYPNPATDYISISADYIDATIYDISGKRLLSAGPASTISVSNLDSGVYIIVINTEAGVITQKLIINR